MGPWNVYGKRCTNPVNSILDCAPADIDEKESSQREELVIRASTTNMEREQWSIQWIPTGVSPVELCIIWWRILRNHFNRRKNSQYLRTSWWEVWSTRRRCRNSHNVWCVPLKQNLAGSFQNLDSLWKSITNGAVVLSFFPSYEASYLQNIFFCLLNSEKTLLE